jgi:hypothetical protein
MFYFVITVFCCATLCSIMTPLCSIDSIIILAYCDITIFCCDTTGLFCIIIVLSFIISVISNFISMPFVSSLCPNVPREWTICVFIVTYYTITVLYYDIVVAYCSILYTSVLSLCLNESSQWHTVSLQCHLWYFSDILLHPCSVLCYFCAQMFQQCL